MIRNAANNATAIETQRAELAQLKGIEVAAEELGLKPKTVEVSILIVRRLSPEMLKYAKDKNVPRTILRNTATAKTEQAQRAIIDKKKPTKPSRSANGTKQTGALCKEAKRSIREFKRRGLIGSDRIAFLASLTPRDKQVLFIDNEVKKEQELVAAGRDDFTYMTLMAAWKAATKKSTAKFLSWLAKTGRLATTSPSLRDGLQEEALAGGLTEEECSAIALLPEVRQPGAVREAITVRHMAYSQAPRLKGTDQ